jgi:transcription initiation factor TFIIIB Brf1 subunit/transcription initiation factor TFIIB
VQRHRAIFHISRPRIATTPQVLDIPLFRLYPEDKEIVDTQSKELFQKAPPGLRGRRHTMAAIVWLTCRLRDLPVLLNEVASAYSTTPSDILDHYGEIRQPMDIEIRLADPMLYIDRLRRALDLPEEVVLAANHIAQRNRVRCQNPVSLAAGSTYVAAQKAHYVLRQEDICSNLSLSQPTIRNVVTKIGQDSQGHIPPKSRNRIRKNR